MKRASSLVVLCVTLNIAGAYFSTLQNGLLFLDTIGTAVSALALGPWWGGIVGAVTNGLLATLPCKQQYHNYLIVNVVCGLYWGVAGRLWLNLFTSADSYRWLLTKILIVGATGGVLASTLSLFTTFNFVWNLAEINPETFRQWHLTDRYYRWLLSSSVIDQSGNILQVLFRDIIGILPDKIVSVAVAVYLLYYGAPKFEALARRADPADIYPSSIGFWIFGVVTATSVASLLYRGQISIDPETCVVVAQSFIPVQVALWSVPLVAWLVLMICFYSSIRFPGKGDRIEAFYTRRTNLIKIAYRDVLTILAAVFAIVIITSQKHSSAAALNLSPIGKIGELMSDGFGILTFFAVFAFLPGFILRLFGLDPDVEDEELGE